MLRYRFETNLKPYSIIRVLYFSIHRYENGTFWPNLRESHLDYVGAGKGLGYNINFPLNSIGMNDIDYLAIVFHILLPVAYEVLCGNRIFASAFFLFNKSSDFLVQS